MHMKEHAKETWIKENDKTWWNFTLIYFLPIKKDSNQNDEIKLVLDVENDIEYFSTNTASVY